MDKKVKDIGEDALISRLVGKKAPSGDVVIGPGDDCAVIDPGPNFGDLQLLKTDCVIESVHFLPGTDPERVGWKAMCRVISDIAAMGGLPGHALVTLAVDSNRKVSELEGWYRGMRRACSEFGDFPIVGGETASLPFPGALISIAMTGRVARDKCATRSGARSGDLIAVTGLLGGSFASGRHLDFRPRLKEARWLMDQDPACRPSAMMDLSDGLARDLPRLTDLSEIPGYEIDPADIPVHPDSDLKSAIGEGEDYELLMTIPTDGADKLLAAWGKKFPQFRLTVIGKMTGNSERTLLEGGWDHFDS